MVKSTLMGTSRMQNQSADAISVFVEVICAAVDQRMLE
jgi:hypothetical protein